MCLRFLRTTHEKLEPSAAFSSRLLAALPNLSSFLPFFPPLAPPPLLPSHSPSSSARDLTCLREENRHTSWLIQSTELCGRSEAGRKLFHGFSERTEQEDCWVCADQIENKGFLSVFINPIPFFGLYSDYCKSGSLHLMVTLIELVTH